MKETDAGKLKPGEGIDTPDPVTGVLLPSYGRVVRLSGVLDELHAFVFVPENAVTLYSLLQAEADQCIVMSGTLSRKDKQE